MCLSLNESFNALFHEMRRWEFEKHLKRSEFFSPFFLKLILYFFRFCSSIHIWVHNSWHISVLSRLEKAQLYIGVRYPNVNGIVWVILDCYLLSILCWEGGGWVGEGILWRSDGLARILAQFLRFLCKKNSWKDLWSGEMD